MFCHFLFFGFWWHFHQEETHDSTLLCVSCPVHPFTFERPKPMAQWFYIAFWTPEIHATLCLTFIWIKIMTSVSFAWQYAQCPRYWAVPRRLCVFDFCGSFSCIAKYKTLYSIHHFLLCVFRFGLWRASNIPGIAAWDVCNLHAIQFPLHRKAGWPEDVRIDIPMIEFSFPFQASELQICSKDFKDFKGDTSWH